ncbi:haloacid dehalogenase type II [Psychromonas sp. psych-6C06]|uniref:haloacid dehalogenase type II n=1 Tax=Psychromonas sp. psych-6C06 TaxID=2058089 RepID=UPI000C347846|nr:haloacid dehalogenase type II [Psychromonas sp. psych-6C06]PKF62031.1 haloacid dehalogenase type II [Psychromonas sp. psych-6C06]
MRHAVIVFDINETVLNLAPLKPKFAHYFGDKNYVDTWFSMLLHCSTVCVITQVNTDFKSLAETALYSLAAKLNLSLSEQDCQDLLSTLASLPVHEDVKPSLTKLRNAGFKLVAFSNSSTTLLTSQLHNAGLNSYFDDAISVQNSGTFKPAADAYQFVLKQLRVSASDACLVACHDWDIQGALSAGLKGAFIDRASMRYNPVYAKPDICATSMGEIADKLITVNMVKPIEVSNGL